MCQAHTFSQLTLLLSALGLGKGNRPPKSTAAAQQKRDRDATLPTPRPSAVLDSKHVIYTLSLKRLKYPKGSQPREPSLRKSLDC